MLFDGNQLGLTNSADNHFNDSMLSNFLEDLSKDLPEDLGVSDESVIVC